MSCQPGTVCLSTVGKRTAILHPIISGHFTVPLLCAIPSGCKMRNTRSVVVSSYMFHPDDLTPFTLLLTELYNLASSSDYIRDMRINEKLGSLLTLLMEQSWHPESVTVSRKRMELAAVKEYLDEHFTEKNYAGRVGRVVLYQQVLSIQNLQRELRNDGQ